MISPENNPPYSRITVPEYLSGEVEEEHIYFAGQEFYSENKIETRLGRKLANVDPKAHTARLDSGEALVYDRLLLATGSRPFLPAGIDPSVPGVFSLWNKEDSEKIAGFAKPGDRAVIIGGGLVGMQGARALTAAGLSVSVVELADRLMAQQLDGVSAQMLRDAAENAGIGVYLSTSLESIRIENGRAAGAVLSGGIRLPTEMVLVCVGVRPNLSMLDGLDVAHDRGIEVNERMQTPLPDVYAAGDVVLGHLYGSDEKAVRAIWLNAVEQGAVAGENMAGGNAVYGGSRSMNSIQLFGLSLASAGYTVAREDMREIVLSSPAEGTYGKLVLDGKTIVGMLLAGDIRQAGVLYHKIGTAYADGFWGRLPRMDVEAVAY